MKRIQSVLGALLVGGLIGLLPGEARASGFEVRFGGFLPKLDSILFADSIQLYTVQKDDFNGFFWGGEFTHNIHPNVEVALALEGYAKEIPTMYRDYTRDNGREILQTLRFQTIPLSAIVRAVPSGRYRKITPYIGGGFTANFWEYEEWGDFIDFDSRDYDVYFDSFKSEGTAWGPMVNAGIRYRVTTDFQIVADYRHFWGKEIMDGDFRGNEIDVSGHAITAGFRLIF